MNKDCNVVRDLMPLCIDRAASEESQRMVEEHVAKCAECAAFYAEMDERLILPQDDTDQHSLDAAAKKLKKRRMRRSAAAGIIGMLLGILVFLFVVNAEQTAFLAKYVRLNGDLRFDAVYVAVYKQSNGAWSIKSNSLPSGKPHFSKEVNVCYTEDGKGAYLQIRCIYEGWETDEYDYAYVGTFGNCFDEVWSIPNYDSEAQEDVPILWVELLSGNDSRIIWRQGDETMTQAELDAELESLGYGT